VQSLTRKEGIQLGREWMVRLEIDEEQVFEDLRLIYDCAPPAVQLRFAELVKDSAARNPLVASTSERVGDASTWRAGVTVCEGCTEPPPP